MKQLFFSVVLLAVVGIVGFLYRATLEGPLHGTNMATSTAAACTAEAKICPDGSSVGRSGPSCEFAACAFPNVAMPAAGIAFALPIGYKADAANTGDTSLLGAYEKVSLISTSSAPETIVVRRFPIPAGKDANSVMLAQTMYESSGLQPKSMQEFKPVIINGTTYQMIVVERFEAIVHVEYYLPRTHDVLRFEALERNVMNWSDPALNVRTLPSVAALESTLGTLQSNEPGA